MRRRTRLGSILADRGLLSAAYSQGFQEREERVRWAISARACSWRRRLGERLLLETEVGVEVHAVGRADVLVAEPEGDGGGVDTMAEQVHGAAVTQRVGRDVLGGQRWERGSCGGDVAFDETADGVAAEAQAFRPWEQRVARDPGALVEPSSKDRPGLPPQGGDPLFAPFAVAANMGAGAELDRGTG